MMRSIVLDELSASEIDYINGYLDINTAPSGLENIYWLTLDKELWAPIQLQAQAQNESDLPSQAQKENTFRMAVEVSSTWVRFELLIRTESIQNIGGGLANQDQSLFVLKFIEEMTSGFKP